MRGDDFYIGAFWELSSCRQFGNVLGPIPWHRIVQYADRVRLEPDVHSIFVDVIRRLDETYMAWQRDRGGATQK